MYSTQPDFWIPLGMCFHFRALLYMDYRIQLMLVQGVRNGLELCVTVASCPATRGKWLNSIQADFLELLVNQFSRSLRQRLPSNSGITAQSTTMHGLLFSSF